MKKLSNCLLAVLVFYFLLCLTACTSITGTGPLVTESRSLSEVTGIDLEMNATVYVIKGDTQSVVIRAQQNILDVVSTEVNRNTLEVKATESISVTDPVQIWITIKTLESVELSGAGTIQSATNFIAEKTSIDLSGSGKIELVLSCEKLDADISGSGELNLKGRVSSSDLIISGSGSINGLNCAMDKCKINISGSGNAKLDVGSALNASIDGSGIIKYTGNPQKVKSEISGSGSISKLE